MEQGGLVSSSNITITFPHAFSTYVGSLTSAITSVNNASYGNVAYEQCGGITKTSVFIRTRFHDMSYTEPVRYMACGY